jgi:hypothetical protein
LWKDLENTEENCEMQIGFFPYFPYLFTVQLAFLPFRPYLITVQLAFLPYFQNLFTIKYEMIWKIWKKIEKI